MGHLRHWLGAAALIAAAGIAFAGGAAEIRAGVVTGVVRDVAGVPVAGAVVRIQATTVSTVTGPDGAFALNVDGPVAITAWAPGTYITGGEEHRPGEEIELVLQPLPAKDSVAYDWISVEEAANGCARCHSSAGSDLDAALPVDGWSEDAHGNSARNIRFLTMYAGTDVDGNQSPATRTAIDRDYGPVPLPPDPAAPYYGPGYKLDFPTSTGNCAACHAPTAAADDPYGIDPTTLTGVEAEGIGCDFCHKIADVVVEEETGLPAPLYPGVLSIELLRPSDGHQFFAGPLDDVAPGEDTYSALQTDSRYCAACHVGRFWDTVVYDSYGEWLRSPYSDPVFGRTCQDCHMPSTGATVFALPSQGGLERDPAVVKSHLMPGAADAGFIADALDVTATAERAGDELVVTVTVANVGAGHHVPTDSPLRHLILLVDARDGTGGPLPLLDGPIVPRWGGVGDPVDGYYAGLPGTVYAKVLEELWTGVSPTAAYWNPTRVVSDDRIPALGADVTEYRFGLGTGDLGSVEVTLVYRRAFIELADQKGWDVPDLVVGHVDLPLG